MDTVLTIGNLINKLKFYLKFYLWRDKFSRRLFLASGVLVICHFILVFFPGWHFRNTGGAVAVRYNIYFGIDLLSGWGALFLYPFTALAVFLINCVTGSVLLKKERLLSYFFWSITPPLLLINLATFSFVLFLNLVL